MTARSSECWTKAREAAPRQPALSSRRAPAAWMAAAVCCALFSVTAHGEERSFVLKAKRIYTMQAGPDWVIDDGLIVVRDGRIAAVGRDLAIPSFADIIDCSDAVVMPGLVAADSALAGENRSDDSVGPRYRAVDTFDPYADYHRLLAGGVTTVYLNPGRQRLVSGAGGVVKIGADPADAVLSRTLDLVVNLGEAAFDPPPKRNWLVPPSSDLAINPDLVQRPSSRLGQLLQLRESFDEAMALLRAAGQPRTSSDDADDNRAILAEYLSQKTPLRVRALRAVDIEQAIRFCRERGFDFSLAGAWESGLMAADVLEAKAPLILETPLRLSGAEDLGPDPDRLDDQLILDGRFSDLPIAVVPTANQPLSQLLLCAATARRAGISQRDALEAVTCDAARILNLADRVGSIAPGRDADLIVLTGEPLHSATHVRRAFVNGREVYRSKPEDASNVVVRGGTVWTGERMIRDGAVLIEDGRITAVGPTVPVPPGARIVDAGPQAVLTPGFIDAYGHLGLEGDRTRVGADVSIGQAVAVARPDFARVARAGVTTVFSAAYNIDSNGGRVSALHTSGRSRGRVVVKETAALIFNLRDADPATAPDTLKKALEKGKKYHEAWQKYEKELEAFEARGPTKEPEKPPAPAPKPESEEEKPKADPLTGTWEGTISGAPLPEPQQFRAKLKLDGESVEGSVETIFGGGDAVAVSGTFRDGHLSLELDVDIPIGRPRIEADIDREDHMTGRLELAQFRFDLEAERTEKSEPEIRITRRRRGGKDGGPVAPKKDEALEPYRSLFAGTIAVVVDVNRTEIIDAILPVFEEFKTPFVLLNAEGAVRLKDRLTSAKTGVVLPTDPVRRVGREEYNASIDLSRAGIPVAFQSAAEDAARALPDRAAYHVRLGMDATAALRALTIDAARMLRCDDAVGALKPGCRGDVLIFDGPPLEPSTRLTRVFIDGEEVSP